MTTFLVAAPLLEGASAGVGAAVLCAARAGVAEGRLAVVPLLAGLLVLLTDALPVVEVGFAGPCVGAGAGVGAGVTVGVGVGVGAGVGSSGWAASGGTSADASAGSTVLGAGCAREAGFGCSVACTDGTCDWAGSVTSLRIQFQRPLCMQIKTTKRAMTARTQPM